MGQEIHPPTTFIYSSRPIWEGQFQESASDAQLLEDEAEGHPDCLGSLLRVRGSYEITGDF